MKHGDQNWDQMKVGNLLLGLYLLLFIQSNKYKRACRIESFLLFILFIQQGEVISQFQLIPSRVKLNSCWLGGDKIKIKITRGLQSFLMHFFVILFYINITYPKKIKIGQDTILKCAIQGTHDNNVLYRCYVAGLPCMLHFLYFLIIQNFIKSSNNYRTPRRAYPHYALMPTEQIGSKPTKVP